MSLLIDAQGLSRHYGAYQAVSQINLQLAKGEVLGLLGPNGAGKSTTMNMLAGHLAPSEGSIKINGLDLLDEPIAAKRHLGYLPEKPPIYVDMKVKEYLNYCAKLNDIPKAKRKEAIDYAMQRCSLHEVSHRLIGNLSKGYQQRTGIAQAILHSPAVVILDEPTVGLDPVQITEIRQLIRDLGKDHGVILSTHILPEVQAVCDRVQIINKGQTVYDDVLSHLAQQQHSSHIVLELLDAKSTVDYISVLNNIAGVAKVDEQRLGVYQIYAHVATHVDTQADNQQDSASSSTTDTPLLNSICQVVLDQQWRLKQIGQASSSLEHIFIDLVHKEQQEGQV